MKLRQGTYRHNLVQKLKQITRLMQQDHHKFNLASLHRFIEIRGARENNLREVSLRIPKRISKNKLELSNEKLLTFATAP